MVFEEDVLEALSHLKPGETLCSDLKLVTHNSAYGAIWRYFTGDNRLITLGLVCNAVEHLSNIPTHLYPKKKDMHFLESIRAGIRNLDATYLYEYGSNHARGEGWWRFMDLYKCYWLVENLIEEIFPQYR